MNRIWMADGAKANQAAPLHQLIAFAQSHSLVVTSGEHIDADGVGHYPHGGHSSGSLHYQGRAIDVRSHELTDRTVEQLAETANAAGINVYDERERPTGGVWSGPHVHLSVSPPGTHEL